jgi:glycerol dehydrogenase
VIGRRALVFIDAALAERLQPRITAACDAAAVHVECRSVAAEVTESAFAEFAGDAEGDLDVVVGVGGGKTIDLAKGVSRRLGVAVVTVPTIASNDSPASRAIAVYDDQHQLREVPLMAHNPALVLVDTAIIAGAPARFLAAGIGDALSKHFEVEACRTAGGVTMQGTRGLRIASILAAGCYEVLRRSSAAALDALASGVIDEALEDTVEAVILLSGLAFENGGLSIAHAVTRGLMAVPGAAARLHGEHVGYGLLVQFAVEERSDAELTDLREFLASLGLPHSLRGLGAEGRVDAIEQVIAERTLAAPHVTNTSRAEPLTRADLIHAVRRVERMAGD